MNIYDVAREAGVSLSTASKAMNGRKDVKEETRQRVIEVARRLNYHPSHLARGLAKKRTENMGMVMVRPIDHEPMIVNPFYNRVLAGMSQETMARNYNMLLCMVKEEPGQEPEVPKMVREKSVDGFVLVGSMPEGFVRRVALAGIPFVVVDNLVAGLEADFFITHNESGARQAVEHLAGLGHRRIAMACGLPGVASFEARRSGFIRACQDLGLPSPLLLEAAPRDNGISYLEKVFAEPRPSAVFCANDLTAHHLLNMASQRGIKVPEELSVVGFDDIDLAEHAHPPLTTVRVHREEMGAQAVRRLMAIIEKPLQARETTMLPVSLVVRESTSKPKA